MTRINKAPALPPPAAAETVDEEDCVLGDVETHELGSVDETAYPVPHVQTLIAGPVAMQF